MLKNDDEEPKPFKMTLASVQNGVLYNGAALDRNDQHIESDGEQTQPGCELAFISGHSDVNGNDLASIQFNFYCPK